MKGDRICGWVGGLVNGWMGTDWGIYGNTLIFGNSALFKSFIISLSLSQCLSIYYPNYPNVACGESVK